MHCGGSRVTSRDVPEAITQGKGEKDPLWQAVDCLEEAIAGTIADGRKISEGSRAARGERLIPVPALMAAKAAIYVAMREVEPTNVQLARKLGCDEKEVRRMLDPQTPHQTAADQGGAGRAGKAAGRKRGEA